MRKGLNELTNKNLISCREAQKSLLPLSFPDVNNMEFAARFIPSAFVSGDIYNIFRLDEKNVGLYNIDISGHGVSAALFSVRLNQRMTRDLHQHSLLKNPIDPHPHYRINPPKQVVCLLDREDFLKKYGRYFTMVYAIVDTDKGVVSFYRAGHNFPLLIHADASSEYIKGGGAPVGLGIPFGERREQKISLSSGDQFILFSDGINEAFSEKENTRYGCERVQKILKDHYSDPLEQSFDSLIADVKKFQEKDEFSDDVSILGFKWFGNK